MNIYNQLEQQKRTRDQVPRSLIKITYLQTASYMTFLLSFCLLTDVTDFQYKSHKVVTLVGKQN